MKTKWLPILVVLVTIFSFSSCLKSDDDIEYSSNDIISYFALPDILGKQYYFTIDQINGEIYNRDSLPYKSDTIIDKILIKQISSGGIIEYDNSYFEYLVDSVDLRKPLELTVHAPDGKNSKKYEVKVNVHQQEPDSLTWKFLGNKFPDAFSNSHQTIILNDQLLAYSPEGKVATSKLSDGANWTLEKTTAPDNLNINTLIVSQNTLYGVTTEGEVFESTDGLQFNKNEIMSQQFVVTLIHSYKNKIFGIVKENETTYFATITLNGDENWSIFEEVPTNFPIENISAINYTTRTGTDRIIMVGKPESPSTTTTPWFTTNGKNWFDMTSETTSLACPYMDHPTLIHYDNKFYIFGGEFKSIYTSKEAITWRETKEKFLLNASFLHRTNYSLVVDDNNYIWTTWGNEKEIWRGRLNKLGFKNYNH